MNQYERPEVKSKTVPLAELYPVMEEVLSSGGTFSITVSGNSMYPFLKHMRDQAVFAPIGARSIRRGDIVFYQRASGQFVMHRVYCVDNAGVMTMLGDAQWTLEPGIRPEQLRAYVIKVVRKGKEINCERGYWRRVMTAYLARVKAPRLTRFILRAARYAIKLVTDPACVARYIRRKRAEKRAPVA